MLMQAVSKNPLSWNLDFIANDKQIMQLRTSWLRKANHLIIDDTTYQLYRQKRFSGDFVLALHGKPILQVNKDWTAGGRFQLNHQGINYRLHGRAAGWSPWADSTFTLYQEKNKLGSIVAKSGWASIVLVDLPDELDLPVQGFLAWLAVFIWKRTIHMNLVPI